MRKFKLSPFFKVCACRNSFKNSIFPKLPKIVEEHFLWWVEQIILTKNIFFAQFKIVQIFTIFVRDRACRYSFKKSIFQKLRKIVEKHFLLMSGTNYFAKMYFLSTNWDSSNYHHFLRSAPVDIPSKIQFSKNCLKCGEHFLWWVEQIILTKNIFFAQFKIVQIFTIFVRDRACRYSFKNSIFQKLRKIDEKHFLWWVEQIILPKNIFLAQIEKVQIITIFYVLRLSIFLQKFNFPKIA